MRLTSSSWLGAVVFPWANKHAQCIAAIRKDSCQFGFRNKKESTKYKEGDETIIKPLPNVSRILNWQYALRKHVAGISGRPDEAFKWIQEVENTTDKSTLTNKGWETLGSKLAASLSNVLSGGWARQIQLEENG